MFRFLAALIAGLFLTTAALAQSGTSVKQSGSSVTPNTVPYWVTNGVIGDSVTAADSPVTSFGVTSSGSSGICTNSARQSSGAWNSLCLGYISGVPTLSVAANGGATAQPFQFAINGSLVQVPTGGGGSFVTGTGSFTSAHVPCMALSSAIIQDCGVAISPSGTISSGIWGGTAVGVGFGGTGATTSAAARTNLGLGTMATQNASAVAITGGTVTGLPTPTASSDATTKSYVDGLAQGLTILAASNLATTTVLPNTPTYNNGTSGVGATLTSGANATLVVDSVSVTVGQTVVVKNQSSTFQNGIYVVTQAGDGSNPWILTRVTYFDTSVEMVAGSYTNIISGATNVGTSWALAATVATVGTSAVTFNQFSGDVVASIGGVTGTITLGTGLQISGQQLTTAPMLQTSLHTLLGGI